MQMEAAGFWGCGTRVSRENHRITTDNMNYPIDVEVEKIGLKVPFGDINSWKKAIEYVAIHPKEAKTMGEAGRYLAERIYNLEHFSSEVASCLLSVSDNSV